MQLVGRLGVAKYDDQGPVEELRTVNFDLIGESVSWKLCYVSFEVQYMQAWIQHDTQTKVKKEC